MILSFVLLVIVAVGKNPIQAEAGTQDGTYYFSPVMTTKFQIKNNKLSLKVSESDPSGITKKGDEKYKKYSLKLKVSKNCKYCMEDFNRGTGKRDVQQSNYNDVKDSIKWERDAYVKDGFSENAGLSRIVVKNNKVVKIVYFFA